MGDIASLKVAVDTNEVRNATTDLNKLGGQSTETEASVLSMAAGIASTALSFAAITIVIKSSIQASVEYENAMRGLASVARFSGEEMAATMKQATNLTTDGLLSTTEAATALKNLLLRGFSTDEAVQMINRFKDSAAFGRQSSLEFGQAVVSATEGIKNENSILVDNAGVTKNVSVMHKEYAESIGKVVTSLTLAEKRHAELNGVMRETEAQTGNAALMADGYQGALAKMNKQAKDGSIALGQQLTPALSEIIKGFNDATAGTNLFYNSGAAVSTLIETIAILGANVAFVFKGVGTEIGGLAAQLVALSTLDFDGFKAIGKEMKKDAEISREELDKWEKSVLSARDRMNEELKKNPINIGADTGARRKDEPIKGGFDEKEEQRKREELAKLQDKTLSEWVAGNEKFQSIKDQAGMNDEQRVNYAWSKELEVIEARKNKLIAFGQWTVDREIEYGDAKNNAATIASDAMVKIKKQEQAAIYSATVGALSTISSLMSSKNKEQFAIGKAAAIAHAIIATQQGMAQALAIPYIGWALAAAVGLAGAANVANIASTQIGGGTATPTNATFGGIGTSTNIDASPTPALNSGTGGQAVSVNIYNTGNVLSPDYIDSVVITQIKDRIANADVTIIDPRSRQAQMLVA